MKISDKLKTVKFGDIKPHLNNAKIHDQAQADLVKKSIENYDYLQPIVLWKDNIIIMGHCRFLALEAMGKGIDDDIEVIDCSHLTKKQADKLRILDNKSNESGWDKDLLKVEFEQIFEDVEIAEIDVNEIGFSANEIQNIIGMPETEGDDDIPEEVDPITQMGDLWELGRHRVLCGDSTKEDDVNRLMDGRKADMVFTDPPYNVSIGTIKHPKFKQREIKNDSMTDDEYREFCAKIAEIIKSVCYGCVYVCGAQHKDGRILFVALDAKLHTSTTIIWNKDVFTLGRSKYQNKYEPIWFGWNESGDNFVNSRNLTNVWDIPRPKRSELHPTTKPTELVERAITHASVNGHIVFDLFLGSGSTLIACEKTNRICYGMEIDPHYCDVIVKRYIDFCTKNGINTVIKRNGEEYFKIADNITEGS